MYEWTPKTRRKRKHQRKSFMTAIERKRRNSQNVGESNIGKSIELGKERDNIYYIMRMTT